MARDKSGVANGFDEGVTCLSSQSQTLLHDPCDTAKANMKSFPQNRHHCRHHHHLQRRPRFPAQELPMNNKKSSSRVPLKPKLAQNWASGGSGMQAIFLESGGQKSCGTGVFLPQRAGTNQQACNKKPGCAPVLLPSRVVEALNINVQALGLQISPPPRRDSKSARKGGDNSKKMGNRERSFVNQKRSSSPELFLPKEWTY